ncbi:MAG: (2Fe-2S)-binding protein [Planctomycetaceae bacterium]|nr:(2Fe-2S)-binding protein [Planctomycetaceae bacterium]
MAGNGNSPCSGPLPGPFTSTRVAAKPTSKGGFSRRSFLKGSGAAVAATAVATHGEEAQAQENAANVVRGPKEITLNVNGEDRKVSVEPRMSLLEVLRQQLYLTGCKDLQDVYVDGADTVMIDGKAVYAGLVFALQAEGKKIRTVESLRQGRNVDPVIDGFVKHDGMQCGYCTPGFVVATRVFLDQHPTASLEEVQQGLGGNICRCGTYDGITKCALELAKGGA